MAKYLALVLHSHFPYLIGHGTWPHGVDWLHEGLAETYIPLLNTFNDLCDTGLPPKITVGITPVLAEQLSSGELAGSFVEYLHVKRDAAVSDEQWFRENCDDHLVSVARMWGRYYEQIEDHFENRYGRDIVGAFSALESRGAIELITSAATHGYLPLLGEDGAIRAQIRAGVETHKRRFGRMPAGIWLPECAYRPARDWACPVGSSRERRRRQGIEEFVGEAGLKYFIVDSHLLAGGEPVFVYHARFGTPEHGVAKTAGSGSDQPAGNTRHSPYDVYLAAKDGGQGDVAFFTRDPNTGLQVWSGEHGFPGDGNYLEFHKKKFPGGLRYWRVTDSKADLGDKQPYVPENVEGRLEENASHFVDVVAHLLKQDDASIVTAPFDAELFGHWWFEGPAWLAKVVEKVYQHPEIEMATCSEYLDTKKSFAVVSLPEGSWGDGGEHAVWLNGDTAWTWERIYDAEAKMKQLVAEHREDNGALTRLLRQLARELLLLESSDWQFLITTWCARDYAEERFQEHWEDFSRLYDAAVRLKDSGVISADDACALTDCECKDSVFETIDLSWWL